MGVANVLSPFLGPALGVGTNIYEVETNKKLHRETLDFNREMWDDQKKYANEVYDKQKEDQWEMYNDQKKHQKEMFDYQFDKTNEYNSPAAQRERLQAAGLNPALMMGGGGMGAAGSSVGMPSVPSASAPSHAVPGAAPANDISVSYQGVRDALQFMFQADQMKAQTQGINIDNQYKAQKVMAEIIKLRKEADSVEQRTMIDKMLSEFEKEYKAAQTDNVRAGTLRLQQEMKLGALDMISKEEQLKVLPQSLQADLASKMADIALRRSQNKLTEQQAKHEVWKMVETQMKSRGQQLDNQYNQSSMDARLGSAFNDSAMPFKGKFGDIFNVVWSCIQQLMSLFD